MTTRARRGRGGSEGSWLSQGAAAARIRETTSSVVGREEEDGERGDEGRDDEGTGRSGGRHPLEAEKGAKAGDPEREAEGEEEAGFGVVAGTSSAPTRSEASTS